MAGVTPGRVERPPVSGRVAGALMERLGTELGAGPTHSASLADRNMILGGALSLAAPETRPPASALSPWLGFSQYGGTEGASSGSFALGNDVPYLVGGASPNQNMEHAGAGADLSTTNQLLRQLLEEVRKSNRSSLPLTGRFVDSDR